MSTRRLSPVNLNPVMTLHLLRPLRVAAALIGFFAATGCGKRITHIPPVTLTSGIDFTEYTKRGFMFTPEEYTGAYESMGVITVSMYAEGNLEPPPRPPRRGIFGNGGAEQPELVWRFKELRVQDVLEETHKRATGMGADAVVRFNVRAVTRPSGVALVDVPGIEVTGFAIKRGTAQR